MEPFRYECGALRLIVDAFLAVVTALLLQWMFVGDCSGGCHRPILANITLSHECGNGMRLSPHPIHCHARVLHDTIPLNTQASQCSNMISQMLSANACGHLPEASQKLQHALVRSRGGVSLRGSVGSVGLLHRPREVVTYNIHAERV